MQTPQARNPLHGVTLEAMLNELVAHFGWPELGLQINIRCFISMASRVTPCSGLRAWGVCIGVIVVLGVRPTSRPCPR